MGRSGKRDTNPGVRPVLKVELSDKNRILRLILIGGFLLVALISFVIGMNALLKTETGWELVESASMEVNCGGDFVFSYCYGQTDENPSAEKKRLTLLYSDAVEQAWRIFHEEILTVSENVNTAVTVDPALYRAFLQIQTYGNRNLYLGPVYTEYNRIFVSSSEVEAADLDPSQNVELAEYVRTIAAFANDPSMIDLQLLGDNRVQLVVAPEYLAFADEYEITEFLDFGWMANAFIADYLADVLTDAGFTNGFLSSYDGFTRNLDERGEQFSLNLFNRRQNNIYLAGAMQYNHPISIVFLRDYPMNSRDQYHYYTFDSGRTVTVFIDPADAMSKSAADSLVGYSYVVGCADILLQLSPVFLSDSLDKATLMDLKDAGICSLWFEDTAIVCNDSSLQVKLNPEAGVNYTLQYIN